MGEPEDMIHVVIKMGSLKDNILSIRASIEQVTNVNKENIQKYISIPSKEILLISSRITLLNRKMGSNITRDC